MSLAELDSIECMQNENWAASCSLGKQVSLLLSEYLFDEEICPQARKLLKLTSNLFKFSFGKTFIIKKMALELFCVHMGVHVGVITVAHYGVQRTSWWRFSSSTESWGLSHQARKPTLLPAGPSQALGKKLKHKYNMQGISMSSYWQAIQSNKYVN